MKKFLSIIVASLALTGQVQAGTVCQNCEYVYYGRYLGQYWPADRGSFGNRNIAAEVGASVEFDDYWVFDLNNNGSITFSVQAKGLVSSPPFAVELYLDVGSTCGALRCTVAIPVASTPLLSGEATRDKWQGKIGPLVPGRYLIRVAAATKANGDGSYSGTISVR